MLMIIYPFHPEDHYRSAKNTSACHVCTERRHLLVLVDPLLALLSNGRDASSLVVWNRLSWHPSLQLFTVDSGYRVVDMAEHRCYDIISSI